ncbi:hypothetical protein GJW-30_1_02621 [Variibacter gotjawalensis]|uniref:Uncharacterized protein n=1 Tax=Variibacter gotjawalensis TaxID=1333996 RepID=A0A0S3PW08_9BRAD|nr:hypothetical protein [Variibacter gotjawalensis]NIK45912.1 hypothetical protein [Variibacter gotjawalensis]RZS47832.1 hypothetical protein EV661_0225 [Variibacter gotjawalensis]BAT60086.1 hypothetical protein GJW-30_1_02621 [Variibacter gotjawalensis]
MKSALLGFAALLAMTVSASAQDVGGRYAVQGKNPNGSNYGGTAEITVTSQNTCRIVWKTGSSSSRGICMRNGNSFAASYVLGKDVGLVIYEIQPDRSMRGIWTIADQTGVGGEILTPQ